MIKETLKEEKINMLINFIESIIGSLIVGILLQNYQIRIIKR